MIGSKMKEVMKLNGWDQYSTAQSLNISQPALNLYMNNKRNVPNAVIKKFCEVFKITADVLYCEDSQPTKTLNLTENSVSIKIVDVIACCGNGIEALQENIIGTWDIPLTKFRDFATTNPKNAFMFQVAGDSMQPTLNSGDWAVADVAQNYISSDGLYLIKTASGISVKRILSGLSDISIISDNPNYPNITASVGEVQILGRIIYTLNAHKIG